MKSRTGLLGELLVELKLVELEWHVVRLNARQASVNTDLIAIKGDHRVSIQVKTTGPGHSHSNSLHLGNAKSFLTRSIPFFNATDDPLTADAVIAVNYKRDASRFFILPVSVAETLCREHARYWSSVPKRDREKRGDGFPVYLHMEGRKKTHWDYHSKVQRIITAHENKWDLLSESAEKLRDAKNWRSVA